MVIDEKRSELFDYLICLQFLKEDPLEKNSSLFDRMLDPIYVTLREELLKPLKENVIFVNRYANTTYNIFINFFQMVNPESAEDYFLQFEKAKKDVFVELIVEMLSMQDKQITTENLEQTDLLDEYKWAIYSYIFDFEYQRSMVLNFLKEHYFLFCRKRKDILERVSSQRKELLDQIENDKKDIFLKFLPQERAKELFEHKTFFFLVSSPTLFYLYKKDEDSYMAIGCYLFPYLTMKERVQKEFVEKRKTYLKILADENRYGILQKLTEGISSNKILAEIFNLSPPGVSYQLNALTKSGVINYSKEKGKYVLNDEELKKIFSSILLDFGISENT